MSDLTKNIIILIFSVIMLFSVSEAQTVDCKSHPIYCQIVKNKKDIDRQYAMQLSGLIHKATRAHDVPPRIFTAILAQESQYRLETKGCHYGFREETASEIVSRCSVTRFNKGTGFNKGDCIVDSRLNPVLVKDKVCSDFGIGQIYYKTAVDHGFDISRLINDLQYSINASAKILSDFKKRYKAKESDWWTRYNARNKTKRLIYKSLVERFM